jgi:Flp pilus assembly protein TadG
MVLRWYRQRRAQGDDGVTLLIVALSVVVILGAAAFAVDLGNARQITRETQGAVDAAALAGARDLPLASTAVAQRAAKQQTARNTAMTYAVRDLFGPGVTPPTCSTAATCSATVNGIQLSVTTPWNPQTDSYPANPSQTQYLRYIHVEACRATDTFFARALNQESPDICREAVARFNTVGGGFDYGLVATDPSKCSALTFAGDSETVLTSNGSVMVNSNCTGTNTGALDASGSSWQLRFVNGAAEVTGYIGVVGSATLQPCDPTTQTTKCTQTTPTTGIDPFGDPLSGMIPPTDPGGALRTCKKTGGDALTPGKYNDCKITNGDVTMQPGIYWFENGFEMNGGSLTCVDGGGKTCEGDGILMYVKTGALKLNGNGRVYLPPYNMTCAEGQYYTGTCLDGLTVWQVSSDEASINGTNDFSIGTTYFPNAHLKANGNGGGAEINVTGVVVAKTVGISGTFDFTIVVPIDAPDVQSEIDIGLEK